MNNRSLSVFRELFKLTFLSYLAILPMSHTVALRNILLLVLVLFVVLFLGAKKDISVLYLLKNYRQVPVVVLVWILFLLSFPFLAVQTDVAWLNLRGQWIQSILAWVVGFAAVVILGKNGPGLWTLAFSSSFLILVHLVLFFAAWVGLLGNEFYSNPSFSTAWNSIISINIYEISLQEFPAGFLGVEPLHFNLGHAACQAVALFGVCFLFSWRDERKYGVFAAVVSILLCFSSIFIAESRGAIIFSVLIILLVFVIYFIKYNKVGEYISMDSAKGGVTVPKLLVLASIIFLLFVAFKSVRDQERWYSMVDKLRVGFLSKNPIEILCNGISPQVEKQVKDLFSDRDPAYIQVLLDGLKQQDGGRILLMRAGVDLVLENPRGLDGSKQSYQKLIKEKCGHEPALQFSHAHHGWINLALALGWIGVFLFSCLLVYFLCIGWININNLKAAPWAMGLFMISSFWILRGFSDEVYREHYLQMQALVLAYLFWRMRLSASEYKTDDIQNSPLEERRLA